jgi:hypothetical protein
LGYGNLVETPDKKNKNKDCQLGISDGPVHGIEKERRGRNRNNVADGIGQMPVIYMVRIDERSVSVSQKETESEAYQRPKEVNQPSFIALHDWRI